MRFSVHTAALEWPNGPHALSPTRLTQQSPKIAKDEPVHAQVMARRELNERIITRFCLLNFQLRKSAFARDEINPGSYRSAVHFFITCFSGRFVHIHKKIGSGLF
jgi:hypothetical protein